MVHYWSGICVVKCLEGSLVWSATGQIGGENVPLSNVTLHTLD